MSTRRAMSHWTTIGDATVKYHAWYEADGMTVGVLTYNADDDYELGETLIANRLPPPRAPGLVEPPNGRQRR